VERDGFVMAEGAGTLILEEYEHAKARGATIYAEVAGAAMTADAYHITATHPEGLGAAEGMRRAVSDAELNMEDVDHLNMHATSTPVGDISEINAIKKAFGDDPKHLNITATKSVTGHMMGAAGAGEAIITIKTIQDGIVPGTINTENIDPEVPKNLDIVFGDSIEKEINVAMSNTFGFGGHNGIVMFKKMN